MFSQASVILSTGGGACMAGGACVQGGACMAGGRGACVAGVCAWQGVYMARETATAADGTHPTGMHFCLFEGHCYFAFNENYGHFLSLFPDTR